jgi:predicted metal-binding protein
MRSKDIDPVKCPHLYRAIKRMEERNGSLEAWARVVALRTAGQQDAAERLVRKLLGVQGPPMSEETKEKLRQYNEAHKEEIKTRRERDREIRKRTIALLTTGKKKGGGK